MNKIAEIAIFAPEKNAYSETFITSHKKFIRGSVHFLYGGLIPKYSDRVGLLRTYYMTKNWYLKYLRLLPEFLYSKIINLYDTKALNYYLKHNRIKFILIEYGIVGAENYANLNKLGIPFAIYFHGYDAFKKNIIDKYKTDYSLMFHFAEKVFVVSSIMRNKIEEFGCQTNKIILNPCAPDNLFFKIKPNFSNQQFLFVGRFVDKKAPYYVLYSFRKALSACPGIKLVMAGEGPLLEVSMNICKFLKLDKHVSFIGRQSHQNIHSLMKESIALIQHSITTYNGDSEGTPVSIMEAMAAGIPIISTYHSGISDVVEHGKTGFLSNEHDINSMGEHIIIIARDIAMAKIMGAAAKREVALRYSMKRHIGLIQEQIDLCLKG